MQIRGFQKTSFVDYPGEICSTVFVGGCNLRCPFCFNRDLVLQPDALPLFREEEIFEFLEKRLPVQGALCISGGEPALQEDLSAFLAKAKKTGLKVKLDTNGTFPEILEQLLEEGNLDYVAVDFKAPPQKYEMLTGGISTDASKDVYTKLKQTISLLRGSALLDSSKNSPKLSSNNPALNYELRTTVIPTLLDENDLLEMAQILGGASHLVLQQFQPLPTLLDQSLQDVKPYPKEKIEKVASFCRQFVGRVTLRGFN